MIFVVISFNATFPSVFWEEGGGRGGGWTGKAPMHNTNANGEVPHWNEGNTKILK